MSHFTTIKTQIKDLEALRNALEEMGLSIVTNGEARGFVTSTTKGEYVIRLKGPYDIALNKQSDGTYGLTTDWWADHVEKEVGKNYGKLLQLYGVLKAMLEAKKKGFTANRKTQPNGSIKLTLASL